MRLTFAVMACMNGADGDMRAEKGGGGGRPGRQTGSDRRQRLGSEAHLWTQRLLGRGEQGQKGRGRLR